MNVYVKTALTLILGIAASMVFQQFMNKGMTTFFAHQYIKNEELFASNTPYDVVYLGSSRTHTSIHPTVVDSVTGLSSYNGGMDAGNIFESATVLRGFLASHPVPRIALLSVDPFSFNIERKLFFPPQYFHVMSNKGITKSFREMNGHSVFFIRYLPFLRPIYMDDYIKSQAVRGLLGQREFSDKNYFEEKGFLSLGYECLPAVGNHPKSKIVLMPEGLEKLQQVIDLCKTRGIKLILTYAPEYNRTYQSTFTNFKEFIHTIDSMATRNQLSFYRDDNLDLCKDSCQFINYNHLNFRGVNAYSKILGERIASLLK